MRVLLLLFGLLFMAAPAHADVNATSAADAAAKCAAFIQGQINQHGNANNWQCSSAEPHYHAPAAAIGWMQIRAFRAALSEYAAQFFIWQDDGTCPAGEVKQPDGSCVNPCTEAPEIPVSPGKEGWAWCGTVTPMTGQPYSCLTVGVRAAPGGPWAGWVVGASTGQSCDPPTFECPNQYIKRPDGSCEPVQQCPEGVPLDLETGQCVQPAECPTGMAKGPDGTCVPEENLCPAGQIKGPDGGCIEDSGQCGAGQAKGKDGTCKTDADGNGTPDAEEDGEGTGEEGEHKAEDSANCASPPRCSGDEIMCLHAKQLWRIDCNTRKARQVDMDAYCKRPPVCNSVALGDEARNTGCDAVEEAALYLQWKNACNTEAVKDLLSKSSGGSTGNGNSDEGTHSRLDKIQRWLDGTGQEGLGNPEVPIEEAPATSQEWSSGVASSGTCPAPEVTTVTIMGHSANLNFSFDPICQFATYLYAVFLSMGGLLSAFIIAGVRK